MPALKHEVTSETLEAVEVVYLDRTVSSWWNAQRSVNDTATFCGWYWIKGRQEAGPFRTRSAAIRDAYYRFISATNMPRTWTSGAVLRSTNPPSKPFKKPKSTKAAKAHTMKFTVLGGVPRRASAKHSMGTPRSAYEPTFSGC